MFVYLYKPTCNIWHHRWPGTREMRKKMKRRVFTTQKYHLLIMQCCILHISWAIFQTALRACVAELFYKVFDVMLKCPNPTLHPVMAVNAVIRWWLWLNSVTVEHFSFFSSRGITYFILPESQEPIIYPASTSLCNWHHRWSIKEELRETCPQSKQGCLMESTYHAVKL